jgi:hypothetical protein
MDIRRRFRAKLASFGRGLAEMHGCAAAAPIDIFVHLGGVEICEKILRLSSVRGCVLNPVSFRRR